MWPDELVDIEGFLVRAHIFTRYELFYHEHLITNILQ